MRRIVMDAGAVSSRRHSIPAWFTADVTDAMTRLGGEGGVSVTAYVAATLARAVSRHPRVHSVRDALGRIVTFDAVDVNTTVEVRVDGQSFPLNHVLRAAQGRDVRDLHDEIHRVKDDPSSSETLRLNRSTRWYLRVPGPVRRHVFMGSLHRLPDLQRRLIGTVGLTSVGMHGRGAGVGIPFLVHTLDVLVGGLEERPGFAPDGSVVPRQFLWMALVADHDVVDGVPLTRFIADLKDELERGTALP